MKEEIDSLQIWAEITVDTGIATILVLVALVLWAVLSQLLEKPIKKLNAIRIVDVLGKAISALFVVLMGITSVSFLATCAFYLTK